MTYSRNLHYNRNGFRKKRQKFKHNMEEYSDEARDTMKKSHRADSRPYSSRFVSKAIEEVPVKAEQPQNNKMTVTVDTGTFLLLIKSMLQQKLLTEAQLKELIATSKEDNDKAVITDPRNPNREFHITKKTTKGELRDYWIYLMRNNALFCDICGKPITEVRGGRMRLTYDHIQPRSKGGRTDGLNGSAAHSICNGLKTNILPEVWEKVGYEILTNNGIKIDPEHCLYKYVRNSYQR